MKIKYVYKNSRITNFSDLYLNYPSSEFDSPYRSTIPFLHFWNDWSRSKGFMELIGVNLTTHSNVTFSFEYRVNVQKGVGNPSHTDLMLIIDKTGIAIEAKYTEPRYATVKKWRNDSENRRNVLEGWLNLIGSVTGESATIEAVDDIEYQLIHRLASVCHLKVKNRILVYQLFDSDGVKMGGYLSDLSKLKQIVSFNFDCFF